MAVLTGGTLLLALWTLLNEQSEHYKRGRGRTIPMTLTESMLKKASQHVGQSWDPRELWVFAERRQRLY